MHLALQGSAQERDVLASGVNYHLDVGVSQDLRKRLAGVAERLRSGVVSAAGGRHPGGHTLGGAGERVDDLDALAAVAVGHGQLDQA